MTTKAIPCLDDLPRRVDRRVGAELITQFFFPVSARSLERCGLPSRRVNGRALYETRDLLAWAASKLNEAPSLAA